MTIKSKQRSRGGSKSSPHTPADLPECTGAYPAFGVDIRNPRMPPCKSSPGMSRSVCSSS